MGGRVGRVQDERRRGRSATELRHFLIDRDALRVAIGIIAGLLRQLPPMRFELARRAAGGVRLVGAIETDPTSVREPEEDVIEMPGVDANVVFTAPVFSVAQFVVGMAGSEMDVAVRDPFSAELRPFSNSEDE